MGLKGRILFRMRIHCSVSNGKGIRERILYCPFSYLLGTSAPRERWVLRQIQRIFEGVLIEEENTYVAVFVSLEKFLEKFSKKMYNCEGWP